MLLAQTRSKCTKSNFLESVQAGYRPELVAVNQGAIQSFGPLAKSLQVTPPSTLPKFGGYATPESTLAFLMVRTALTFQLWSQTDSGKVVEFSRFDLPGSHAIHRTILRMWGESPSTESLRFALSRSPIETLLGADLPNIGARARILEELLAEERLERIATILSKRIEKRGGFVFADTMFLARALPLSFEDPFFHKANLCLALYANLRNRQHSQIEGEALISTDYHMAAVCRAMGLVTYSPLMQDLVNNQVFLESGSKEETSIRAAVVMAADMLSKKLGVSPHLLDQLFWRTRNLATQFPHHLTLTTMY